MPFWRNAVADTDRKTTSKTTTETLTLAVNPPAVNIPPAAQVQAQASGGVPPYQLQVLHRPAGVHVSINGTGPWSLIISGQGSGAVQLSVQDSLGDNAGSPVQVN